MKDETMDEGESSDVASVGAQEGVRVPEDFQVKCNDLLESCDDMACLDYLSSMVSEKRSELYKSDDAESQAAPVKSKKGKTPASFSKTDMPSSY